MTNAHELNGSLTRDIDAIAPREDTPREYLGASNVGSESEAEIAFSHRGFPNNELPPRTERIFELGHMLENLILKHLKKANRNVWEKDGNTGKQYRGTAFNNHIIGNADGIIEVDSEAMLLEIKSMRLLKIRIYLFNMIQTLLKIFQVNYLILIIYLKKD